MNVSRCVRTCGEILPSSVRVFTSVELHHILRLHGHTILQEKRAADMYGDVGETLTGIHGGTVWSKGHSAQTRGEVTRERGTSRGAHLGALVAVKPRNPAMIQDAVMARLPRQPLVTRFVAVIEAATSTYLEGLDDEDKATA